MLTRLHELDNIGQSLTGLDSPYVDFNFFTRPKNWDMLLHKHLFFQFLLVIEGELYIITENEEVILKRGMVSIIPPDVLHSLKTHNGYKQFGINLGSNAGEDRLIKILSGNLNVPVVLNMPGLLDYLPEIEDCSRLQTMVSIQKIRNRLEYMLLTCIETIKKQDSDQAFREKLINYFKNNILENITLKDISVAFYMSKSHIERLSYKEFGCGAIRLFNRLKMDRARILLQNTDLSISDISTHLGYHDQGYFSRIFKKYEGVSPRIYQNQSNF